MSKFDPNKMPKPIRYIVNIHNNHNNPDENYGLSENSVSYNTALDGMENAPSAYSQAIHTASRYGGEIIAVYENNNEWVRVRNYR